MHLTDAKDGVHWSHLRYCETRRDMVVADPPGGASGETGWIVADLGRFRCPGTKIWSGPRKGILLCGESRSALSIQSVDASLVGESARGGRHRP